MVLEMQDGAQNFVARLAGENDFLRSLPIGSPGSNSPASMPLKEGKPNLKTATWASFELLLDSPSGCQSSGTTTLVDTPAPAGHGRSILVCILVVAALWITQLHRKVEERTVQLEEQIQKRQNIEQYRAMEQERARIAQDLHDELGSGLTEISMLAAVPNRRRAPRPVGSYVDQIGDRARHMVTALDEIVWAMNPKHDSLESLGSYLCLYADRFLKLAEHHLPVAKGTLDLPGQTR
jgi:signal transduction histidine kinase